MTGYERQASDSRGIEAAQSLGFLTSIAICLVLAAVLLRGRTSEPAIKPVVADAGDRINPNEAPVASLIRLPGVGLTRARTIVAYRETTRAQTKNPRVFARPEDLEQVRGIGPGTVLSIRRWLCFEQPAPSP